MGTFKPLVIGIAGGTGSGKTTIARAIVSQFRPEDVTHIQHDAYYRDRPDLSDEEREKVNYDHPDSLDNALLTTHIDHLVQGEPIGRPNYDFVTHRRQSQKTAIQPTPIVIVEGILIFADPALVERLDIKLFVDTPADIRILRRIRRDMERRGRTFDDVRRQYYATVRPMHLAFVEPSRRVADLIIPEGGNTRVAIEVIVDRIRRELVGLSAQTNRVSDGDRSEGASMRGLADGWPPHSDQG
ncbi:MAG TPA: uridine kinase [Myxococcales bacterium]|nr:uridine kinase [Myxococcales bacterium]